ncbi:MAG: adenylate/guanylate cyclase domain-containing protein [Treponema sp.]|nr:adenylate/guanylate cyclase domain-containing protein [Treponema sp.]
MNKRWLSSLCVAIFCASSLFSQAIPKAKNDSIDLSSYQFSDLKTVELSGEWAFWWNKKFTNAAELEAAPTPDSYPPIPSYWGSGSHGGKQFPAQGSATYRLTIHLPDSQVYGLYVPQMVSSYDLYINGALVGSNGLTDINPVKVHGEFKPNVYFVTPQNNTLDIFLFIANRDYRHGGQWKPILLGTAQAVQNYYNRSLMIELFLFGSILVIGLYNIALFLFRPKDKSPLFFGLFCIIVALRVITTGTIALSHLTSIVPWEIQIKLELSVFYLGALFFGLFFKELFPADIPTIGLGIMLAPAVLFTLLSLALPLKLFNLLVTPMEITAIAGLLFVLVCITIAWIRKRENAALILIGFLLFTITAINDVLYSKNIIATAYMLPLGLFSFIFLQAIALARIFSNSFTRVEQLSDELSTVNKSMSRFVPNEFLTFLNKKSINDIKLGDQVLRSITILFADIRSFTTLSETMSPQDNFNFINSYFNRIGPIIRNHHGFIDKYIGDGIMALFPEMPQDAVQASLAIQEQLNEYNKERLSYGLQPISIGIGIHTGLVMLGIIGEQQRIESTVISDTVNLASRIENLTRTYNVPILLSGNMQSYLQEAGFHGRLIDTVLVKGKSQPCDIYELLDVYSPRERIYFLETQGIFEQGVRLYHEKDYEKALKLFKLCYAKNPQDNLSALYIYRIRNAQRLRTLQKDGASANSKIEADSQPVPRNS